jgi:hypothetical protein
MAKTIQDMFLDVRERSGLCLSGDTITALRDYFFGYVACLADNEITPAEGDPPFRHFSDWLARRLGKSGRSKSKSGKVSRYHGGWWMLLDEKCGNQEEAFRQFFVLLDEFRLRQPHVVAEMRLEGSQATRIGAPRSYNLLRMIRYGSDDGIYLFGVDADEQTHDIGYFTSVDDAFRFSESELRILRSQWEKKAV